MDPVSDPTAKRVASRHLEGKVLRSFYLVTNPSEHSEIGDIVAHVDARSVGLIALGVGSARWAKENPAIHTDARSATTDGLLRLERLYGEEIPAWVLQDAGGLNGLRSWKPSKVAAKPYIIRAFPKGGGQYEETTARNWAGVKKEVAAFYRRGMDGFVLYPDGGKSYFHEVRSSGRPMPHYGAVDDQSEIAPSAEGHFFDNPEKREVREFAESNAISNVVSVAEGSGDMLDESMASEMEDVEESPLTPSEIVEEPGGEELSTLNRYVVETTDDVPGVPQDHDDVPKHPDMKEAYVLPEVRRLFGCWFPRR